MKSQLHLCLPLLAASWLVFAGCEIETVEPAGAQKSPASTVVINEVFTLPFSNPGRFNWIEFFNPTNDTSDLTGWTMEYQTYRINTTATIAVDTNGVYTVLSFRSIVDGFGLFQVPFTGFSSPNPDAPPPRVKLAPGGLLTIVDNESRLRDHTGWGPADDRYRRETTIFYGAVDTVDTLLSSDTLTVIAASWKAYGFLLDTTATLVLRNPAGEVVDVVRYGNYVYSGSAPDPYLGNNSIGIMPPYESISRFAGGFKTGGRIGNTANDFFITNQFVRPIPHWYSQLQKQ